MMFALVKVPLCSSIRIYIHDDDKSKCMLYLYSYTRCAHHSVHAGPNDDCSLDRNTGGSDYQLSDGVIEDTDRSDHLFRGKTIRDEILQACDNQCFYCFTSLSGSTMEADHLEAVASGGPHNLGNAVVACQRCNRKKGSISHRKFIEQYGGDTGISQFVRCHEYSHQGKRCKNPESPGTRNYFCHCHGGV